MSDVKLSTTTKRSTAIETTVKVTALEIAVFCKFTFAAVAAKSADRAPCRGGCGNLCKPSSREAAPNGGGASMQPATKSLYMLVHICTYVCHVCGGWLMRVGPMWAYYSVAMNVARTSGRLGACGSLCCTMGCCACCAERAACGLCSEGLVGSACLHGDGAAGSSRSVEVAKGHVADTAADGLRCFAAVAAWARSASLRCGCHCCGWVFCVAG